MSGYIEISRAAVYAAMAHGAIGHQRKYTGVPYIEHPARVARLVAEYCGDDYKMIAAAWLHDVVEDTDIKLDEIVMCFGENIAGLVNDLTDVSKPEDGNRSERKAIDRAHTAAASDRAKTIKLCDLIDNTSDILSNDRKFAATYVKEKILLLDVLRGPTVPVDLLKRANDQVQEAKQILTQEGFM